MNIFDQIRSSILGPPVKAEPVVSQAPRAAGPTPSASAKMQSGSLAAPELRVDVAGVLNKLAREADEDLDWRRSIVDLMKLLKIDSSLTTRKRLAQELGYAGSMSETASMNTWLHKQVMIKLAEHGGSVPNELKG
jgi:hypothetical protein